MFIKNKYLVLLLSIIILVCLIFVLYKDSEKENLNNNIKMIQNINPLDTTFRDLNPNSIQTPIPN